MKKFSAIRDFLWVLQAFLRGKVLRQKAYRPQPHNQGLEVFYSAPGATPRKMILLAKMWGYRPLLVDCHFTTLVERAAKQDDKICPGGDWSNRYDFGQYLDRGDRDNNHRFLAVRH